jgi:hypothetical protein
MPGGADLLFCLIGEFLLFPLECGECNNSYNPTTSRANPATAGNQTEPYIQPIRNKEYEGDWANQNLFVRKLESSVRDHARAKNQRRKWNSTIWFIFTLQRKINSQGFAWYVHICTKEYSLLMFTENQLGQAQTRISIYPGPMLLTLPTCFTPKYCGSFPMAYPLRLAFPHFPVPYSWHTILNRIWHTQKHL